MRFGRRRRHRANRLHRNEARHPGRDGDPPSVAIGGGARREILAADGRTGDCRSDQGARTDQHGRAVRQLMETALAWADAIAMNAPKAEAVTKSLMCKFSGQAIAMSMTEYTAAPHITDESRAGLEAFFEKKPVPWSIKKI